MVLEDIIGYISFFFCICNSLRQFFLDLQPKQEKIENVNRNRACFVCQKNSSLRCSKCKKIYYCSVECQKQDWHSHKLICRPEEENNEPGTI